jgi:hypothetical protein
MTDYYPVGDYNLKIYFESRTAAGVLADPTTVQITIDDEEGTEVVAQVAMTKESTGIYYYTWAMVSVAEGRYKVMVDYDNGGDTGRDTHWITIEG